MPNKKIDIEAAAKAEIEKLENSDVEQVQSLGNIKDIKSDFSAKNQVEEVNFANEIGWKTIDLQTLPTQGMFYPIGTKMAIRAATVGEIRHWSTMDESDINSIENALNLVIEKCLQIVIPGKRAFHKDLKEIDRLYLIFAIRELTFKNGENKLMTDVKNSSGSSHKIEITKDVISYFKPDQKLLKFYSEVERCFIFPLKSGEMFKMYLPSLGITSFLKNYRLKKQQEGKQLDEDFEKFAIFMFEDWRILNDSVYENKHQESYNWSIEKLSVFSNVVDLFKGSVQPGITTMIEGEEVSASLNFPGGIKSLFVIPDVLDQLI